MVYYKDNYKRLFIIGFLHTSCVEPVYQFWRKSIRLRHSLQSLSNIVKDDINQAVGQTCSSLKVLPVECK